MPPLVVAAAIAGGAQVATSVGGARAASKASRRASDTQSRADAEALAFEREREAEAKRQWDIEQANLTEQRNYERRLMEEREARLAPYRATSAAALGKLGNMLGIQVPAMPEGGGGGPASMGGGSLPPTGPEDNERRRLASEAAGYGWGGRRPDQPWDPSLQPMPTNLPTTLGAQLQLRSRRPIDPLARV